MAHKVSAGSTPDLSAFLALLDRCKAQAQADPAGYTENPHLYDALHLIHLRLCHGNIPDYDVGG